LKIDFTQIEQHFVIFTKILKPLTIAYDCLISISIFFVLKGKIEKRISGCRYHGDGERAIV